MTPLRLVVVLGLAAWTAVGTAATAASLLAQTSNPANAVHVIALTPPSGLTAAPRGQTVSLGWSAGSNGSGYALLGAANGSSSDCSAANPTAFASTSSLSYTDSRYTPQGTWYCYEVRTSFAGWTSLASNPRVGAQLGVVATSISLSNNGGVTSTLDTGDRIVVTFNQPINPASLPAGTTVCTYSGTGAILLGVVATAGACSSTETVSLGRILGLTTGKNVRFATTWAWSNANTTVTLTIGVKTAGGTGAYTGTASFGPTTTSTALLSATGGFHVCDTNTGGGSCLPVATGSL